MNHINAQWNAAFPEKADPVRFWGPNVIIHTPRVWIGPPREDMEIVDPVKAAETTPPVEFDCDPMWVNYRDNRFKWDNRFK